MEWMILQEFEKQGVLAPLDLYYARRAAHYAGGGSEEIAAVLAATMAAARLGHLCLYRSSLTELFPPVLVELLERGFSALESERQIWQRFLHLEQDRCYLPKNWELEQNLLFHLRRLAGQRNIAEIPNLVQLNREQQQAVETVLRQNVTILTGGPGTGKTFTAAAIVQAFPNAKKIVLAAFTGRAADHLKKRMIDCGIDSSKLSHAGTLHKLLGRKALRTLPEVPWIDADLILIDESSMIDAPLFVALLASLPEGCTLVLMGDPDQLHPVGIGSLFSALVHAQLPFAIGRAHLRHCLRVEDCPLLELASAVKLNTHCQWPLLDWPLEIQKKDEFYMRLWEFAKPFWPQPSPHVPERKELLEILSRFRILSALRQGPLGTDALNERLASWMRAQARPGDLWIAPIQITRNDAVTGLCNGEVGLLIQAKNAEAYAIFESCEAKLPAAILPAYEYAFCTSVHKSQGSEYREVLLIIPPGSESFGKEMLYTGITRAKKKLSIASTPEILAQIQKNHLRKQSGF